MEQGPRGFGVSWFQQAQCRPSLIRTTTGRLQALCRTKQRLVLSCDLHLLASARRGPPRQPGHGRLCEGLSLLLTDRLLRILAARQLLASLSAGATSALLVVLAERHLDIGAEGFGLLIGAIGIGAAIGPFLLTRLTDDPRRGGFVFGPYLLRGAVDLVVATVTALPVALASMAAYGLGASTGSVTFNSLLQAEVRPHLRGRVFAGMDLLWQAGRLVSLGAGGFLADAIGIRAVYYLGGGLLIVAGVLGLAALGPRTPQ